MGAPTATTTVAATWILIAAVSLAFLLMILNAVPMADGTLDVESLEDELAKIHILDTHHRALSLDSQDPLAGVTGSDVAIWQWPEGVLTTDEQRKQVGARFVAENEFRTNVEGNWEVVTLIGQTLTIFDDERGHWQYSSWPTETATKPPVDDANATVSARTVWGPFGEHTEVTIRNENGYRVVEGGYLLNGLHTGIMMRAVLDGGLVVHATGWCQPPVKVHTYLKPSPSDAINMWNRSARGSALKVVSWDDAYMGVLSVDGDAYLMPAYKFADEDGQHTYVTAIDPRIVRVHDARHITTAEDDPVVV